MSVSSPQQTQHSAANNPSGHATRPEQLATISYRSRAVHPFLELQLAQLLDSARA